VQESRLAAFIAHTVNPFKRNCRTGSWLLIAGVLVAGLFFRFYNLEKKAYWYDEVGTSLYISGYTKAEVQQIVGDKEIGINELKRFQRVNPDRGLLSTMTVLAVDDAQLSPLYYGLVRLWSGLFDESVRGIRSLSAFAGLLVFPCLYWLCRELFERRRVAWVALAVVAVSPFHVLYAQEAPHRDHLLGTDDSGRDVLARIIHGARSSQLVGVGSIALCMLFGVLIGAFAAYFGGLPDRMALIFIETLTAFPTFFLILAIQGLLGAGSLLQLVIIIGATRWTDVARVTRAEVLRVVNEDYVDAARALGLGHLRILFVHVLPGAIGPVVVSATFGVAGAILIESTLSFLGYGAPPPTASWGQLLTDAFNNEGCYWLTIFPGLALSLTVLSINLMGEGLREAVDPAD
jgi:ABC-type dipeptide/oligopeptide/nickel transport system permease subunit